MPAPTYDDQVRKYMQMAAYWINRDMSDAEVMAWAEQSRHYYNLTDMRTALPEAHRALYFAERIREADPTVAFSRLWGLASRATWYAGYHRAPTPAEREWAYSRPGAMLGLAFEVVGRGANTGRFRHFTITVNVPWSANLGSVEDYLKDCLSSGACITGDFGSEPLRVDSIIPTLVGGALIERRGTTTTMPG